jgi:hypothetical protein
MKRACLNCGYLVDEGARYCGHCGKPMPSGRASASSHTRGAQRGRESFRFCKQCQKRVRVLGTANYWREKDPVLGVGDEEEWVCEVLECKHRIPIRKTGRTKNPLLDL